jgi:hypothetical protein
MLFVRWWPFFWASIVVVFVGAIFIFRVQAEIFEAAPSCGMRATSLVSDRSCTTQFATVESRQFVYRSRRFRFLATDGEGFDTTVLVLDGSDGRRYANVRLNYPTVFDPPGFSYAGLRDVPGSRVSITVYQGRVVMVSDSEHRALAASNPTWRFGRARLELPAGAIVGIVMLLAEFRTKVFGYSESDSEPDPVDHNNLL